MCPQTSKTVPSFTNRGQIWACTCTECCHLRFIGQVRVSPHMRGAWIGEGFGALCFLLELNSEGGVMSLTLSLSLALSLTFSLISAHTSLLLWLVFKTEETSVGWISITLSTASNLEHTQDKREGISNTGIRRHALKLAHYICMDKTRLMRIDVNSCICHHAPSLAL